MGYGPSDKNRLGWCWRNEHGWGTRMTPYFETEKDVDAFHEYFNEHYKNYRNKLNKAPLAVALLLSKQDSPDLRLFELKVVNKIAEDFALKNPEMKKPLYAPYNETVFELYGCDMESIVGYDDEKAYKEKTGEDELEKLEEEEELETKKICLTEEN